MKKIMTLIAALLTTMAVAAQTLNVSVGNVIYQFPAAQTGEMTYTDGTTLTIMGKAFDAVYTSRLFEKLSDPKTGLYFQSSGYVYSYLEEELDKGIEVL